MADAFLIAIAIALFITLGGKFLEAAAPPPMSRICRCPQCCYADKVREERAEALRVAYTIRRSPMAQAIDSVTADRRGK